MILSLPWGWMRTKCPYHRTSFYQSGTFSICFCGNTDVCLDVHFKSVGFILMIWTLSSGKIVKLKSIKYIPQHLYQNFEIPSLYVPSVSVIISHQHTIIMIWKKANNTAKIFISKLKYFWNCLEFIHQSLILKFQ